MAVVFCKIKSKMLPSPEFVDRSNGSATPLVSSILPTA